MRVQVIIFLQNDNLLYIDDLHFSRFRNPQKDILGKENLLGISKNTDLGNENTQLFPLSPGFFKMKST
jgi:hypothetical protein